MLDTNLKNDFGPRVPLVTVKGKRPGPRLLVIGDESILRDVADLVWARPDLVAINGQLVFRTEHTNLGLDQAQSTLCLCKAETDAQLVFERILGRMTALGMIPIVIANAA